MFSLEKNQIRSLIKGKKINLAKAQKAILIDVFDDKVGDSFVLMDVYPPNHYIILRERYRNLMFPEINFWQVHFITHSNQIKNVPFDKKWLLLESDNLSLNKDSYITSEIFIVNEDNILVSETFGLFDIDKFISDVEFDALA